MGGFSYPDQFSVEMDRISDVTSTGLGIVGVFFIVYAVILLVGFALGVASYVLGSVGMHTIANRRGIRHGWLAWLPMGNVWILGNISDQYQYLVKGKIKNRRKLLLGLELGVIGVVVGLLIATVVAIAASEAFFDGMLLSVILIVFGYLAIVAITVAVAVLVYICAYDLFRSCNPADAVLYLVLSVIFPVAMSLFVFICCKKDLGMPPRKKTETQHVAEPATEALATEEGFAQPEDFDE